MGQKRAKKPWDGTQLYMPGVVGKALYPSSPVRQIDNIYCTDRVHENTWLGEKCWILEIFESPPLLILKCSSIRWFPWSPLCLSWGNPSQDPLNNRFESGDSIQKHYSSTCDGGYRFVFYFAEGTKLYLPINFQKLTSGGNSRGSRVSFGEENTFRPGSDSSKHPSLPTAAVLNSSLCRHIGICNLTWETPVLSFGRTVHVPFRGTTCSLLTCSPRCPAAPGMCWSHTPAGPARPAAPGTPGSAAPGHSWSPPAVIPRCRSGPAPGPAGSCSGPLSPSGCSPGSLSFRGKGKEGHRAAPSGTSPSLSNKSQAPRAQERVAWRAPQFPWLPDLTFSPGVSSIPTRLCWAWSSTSRALTVRLSSMISAWQDCSCSELDTTCLFSSSVWNTKVQKTVSESTWRAPGSWGSWDITCWAAHLPDVPFLHVPAVGLHQGLVLSPGLIEHAVEVHSGGGIHLHVEAVSQLAPQGVDFLMEEGERMNS